MKTLRRITLILLTVVALVAVGFVLACFAWGWRGLVVGTVVVAMAGAGYATLVRPWHTTWRATRTEIEARLPGDELVDGESTTRAITIAAPPSDVWPWLVQLGYGKAGWYSYDWIDNDGRPSATSIVDAWQALEPGDRILMTPDMGFVVQAIAPERHIVSLSDDGSTSWTLSLTPSGDGHTRLVSRFTTRVDASFAALAWSLIVDPGAFIMERRMLLNLRSRAEARARQAADRAAMAPAGRPGPSALSDRVAWPQDGDHDRVLH